MKKLPRRVTALVLAALLAMGPAASASQALGTELHMGTTQLAQGVEYTRQYLWSATYSDLRTERYVEYTPSTQVQPAVSFGTSILARASVPAMAQQLEADGKRVIAGINGDYYNVASGSPLGMVITDGILRSSSGVHYALGFDQFGTAFIGQPSLSITATIRGRSIVISGGLNKVRTETGGPVLYTRDYSTTTRHSDPGIDVILSCPTQPAVGARLSCTVEQVLSSTASIEIPENKLVMSIHSKGDPQLISELASLLVGESVEIAITSPDARWETAVTAIGGLHQMITDGVVKSGLDTVMGPRTAAGIKADGSIIFYTMDGRQSGYSVGASIAQVAKRLLELGCVNALCLDGGGSTTLGATLPGTDTFNVLNVPSDGTPRAVTNALFLVADRTTPGGAESLAITPSDAMILAGSRLELSAVGVDELGQAVTAYDPGDVTWSLPEKAGKVENGVLTAGQTAGVYTLEATAGGLTGSARITVVTAPDAVTLQDEITGVDLSVLRVDPGASLNLTATALYRNLPLVTSDTDFRWSVTGDLGTLSPDGTFTAGETYGPGTLTVSVGKVSLSLPLTVAGHVHTAEHFEADFDNMAGSATSRIMPEERFAYVRYGKQSAAIHYVVTEGESSVSIPLSFPENERFLSLWVYGDGSGNTLTASVIKADGSTEDVALTVLDYTGWKQATAPLPAGAAGLSALKLLPTGETTYGSIWVDQITTANLAAYDTTSPIVVTEHTDMTLTASLQDNMDDTFAPEQVSVTYDGVPLSFELDGNLLTAALHAPDNLAHRVTVTVTDASGNIGRSSIDLAPSEDRRSPFADVSGHWAEPYINYLYDQGISTGINSGNGLLFQPGKEITRGEFAMMVARWMRLDLPSYANVQLPFVDAESIPSWCLDGMKAMYALGVMQGGGGNGGTYANATKTITRAEALTMLGRIQEKGYLAAELNFPDANTVSSWSADYVKILVAQGVINGRPDGTIAPNSSITRSEIAKILYAMR